MDFFVSFATFWVFFLSLSNATSAALINGGSFIHNALSYNPLRELNRRPNFHLNLISSSKNASAHGHRSPGSQTKEYLTISELPDDYQQTSSGTGLGGMGGFLPSLTGPNLQPLPPRYPYGVTKVPTQILNTNLMRRHSISTILAGTLFYSLTILPLIMMLTSTGPFSAYSPMQPPPPAMAMFGRRRRRKRSLPADYHHQRAIWRQFQQMPLLNKMSTIRFLSLLEATFELRQVSDENCKKLHLCNVYHQVMHQGTQLANIHSFEDAMLNNFGAVAERPYLQPDVSQLVQMYHEAALIGISGQSCDQYYQCESHWDQSIYVPKPY